MMLIGLDFNFLGLPVHPILVHFPIAFYFLECILLIWGRVGRVQEYFNFAQICFYFGFVFMVLAIIAGYLDAGAIVDRVKPHFFAAMVVLTLYFIRIFYWRRFLFDKESAIVILIVTSIIGNIALFLTGYYGGKLVHG